MRKSIYLLLFAFCFSSSVFAQSNSLAEKMAANGYNPDEHRTCSTPDMHQEMMQEAEFAAWYNQLQNRVSTEVANKTQAPCASPLIIPVAIHFESATISNQCMIDASLAQIAQINLDFAGCNSNAGMLCDWIIAGCDNFGGTAGVDAMPDDGACIQFCLADQNLPGAETTVGGFAITAGDYNSNIQNASSNWQGYFNVYVGAAGGNLGFVPFLSGASNANNTQGTSVLTSTFGAAGFTGCEGVGTDTQFGNGATFTHEAGHWFGLEHTFGDNVADTPPQTNPNFGCPTVDLVACTTSEGPDYNGNFMDYVDDNCMFTFTQDQVDIMIATADAQANWAIGSVSCAANYPPCADQAGACALVCPMAVTTPYNGTDEVCAVSTPSYDLPTDFSSVVLDDDSDAIYTWSTGAYISAGGVALAGSYAVTPAGCEPIEETFFLNVDCGATPLAAPLDAGTLVLTAYPDPTAFLVTDLVTFTDGACDGPTFLVTPGCETFVTVAAATGSPTFPVATGSTGVVDYDVTLNYPLECCCLSTEQPCTDNANCMLTGAANYDCIATGVGYCDQICFTEYNATPETDDFVDVTLCMTSVTCADAPDASCLTTLACDDTDQCTEGEMQTIVTATSEVCTTCGNGTAVAQCTLPSIAQTCDDGDPCTENDMEEVDACDATIVCVPCAGQVIMPSCGDPAATNYDINAVCIDNALCTYGEYCDDICFAEYTATPSANDTPNALLCVTPVSCTGDSSCFTTQACNDGAPCTTGEMETLAPDGSICTPCGGGTPVTAACGDPTADNYDATAVCIDNTLCTYTAEPNLDISDPCECGNPLNIMIDPADDPADATLMVAYFADEVIIEASAGATITIDNTSPASNNIFNANSMDITSSISIANFTNNGDTDGDGLEEWVAIIWHPVDVGYTLSVDIDGTPLNIGNSCTQCLQSIPTVGEWGLIILGLMMSIIAIVGIRERRKEEIYS